MSTPDYVPSKQDRRDHILQLTNQGWTNEQIAQLLGISTSLIDKEKRLLRDRGHTIVQSTMFRWINIIKAIAEALIWFSQKGIKPTLRTMFYKLVSQRLLHNTKSEYQSLSTHTGIARKGVDRYYNQVTKYDRLPIDCFVDEGRESFGECDDHAPKDPTPAELAEDWEEYINDAIRALKDSPKNYDGKRTEGQKGVNPGRWYNQEYYVEVWIEKAALAGTFRHFLRDKRLKLVVNRGFTSISFMHENCQRLKRYQDDDGKKIVVLYCGDLDPSGDCMDQDLIDDFKFYGLDVEFRRIAVTPEQIAKYNLPADPDQETSEKLERDPRLQKFVKKYGRKFAVELDAMLAYAPDEFEQLVKDAVDGYWDENVYDEKCPDEEYDYEAHGEIEPQDIDPDEVRPMIIQRINEAFFDGWEKNEGYKD